MHELLLDNASEILILVHPNTLEIVEAGAQTLQRLGYQRKDFVGLSVTEVECALSDVFFWEEVRQGGVIPSQEMEGEYLCADGSVLAARKTVVRSGGDPGWLVVRARPTKDIQAQQEELAFVTSHLSATLEASADGVLLVDRAGSIVNMNRRFSALWGIPEALLEKGDDTAIFEFMAGRLASPAEESERLLWVSPNSDDEAFSTLHLHDGQVFECKTRPARQSEQIIGRVYNYTDVTERTRIQEELVVARDHAKAASRAKGEFLAMMSHEIRTPMNGIIGMAQLMSLSPLDEEQAECLGTIRASGEALLAIINDILDYSKIEAGKMELENVVFKLPNLMRDIEQLFLPKIREGEVTYSCALDAAVPLVLMGDPTRLRQILINLVGNAFKFTKTGSIAVGVTVAQSEGQEISLRFSVRDSGIGIAADKLSNIFRPFEQADRTTSRRYGGTGLGLSICSLLAALMGGEIGVNSEEGKGSEFWFVVRFGLTEARLVDESASRAVTQAIPEGTLILLAEDNRVNQLMLVKTLKKLGAGEVFVANDGLEAVELAKQHHFELVFMDVRMPDMDGLEATLALRRMGITARIIGVSADAMEDDRRAALAAGMDDYVVKPVTLPALQAALGRWREVLSGH